MPRSGGVYTLPPVYEAEPNTTIRSEQHNVPLRDIADALTNSLPRDGQAGMTGNLPMGGNRITGLAVSVNAGDAVRRDEARSASNLDAGTVPNARMTDHYTNMQNINTITGAIGSTHEAGLRLRPQGSGQSTNEATLAPSGDLTVQGVVTATSFSGSGAGLTSLPAGELTGTVADARLPSTAVRTSRTISTGDGLTGGGNLSANRTLAVDGTVVRTSGPQALAGTLSVAGGSFTVNSGGHTVAGNITSSTGNVGGSGGLNLRPQGGGTTTNQTVIASNGNMTVQGGVTAASFSGNASASDLNTGTLPSARLGTTNADRDWVLSRTAGAAVGAVGTYAMLAQNAGGSPDAPGSTRAGSGLLYSNAAASGLGDSTSPSGTWRAMYHSDGTNGGIASTGLWLRVNNPVILGHRGPYAYVAGGRIDCEVEFEEHGWLPCTLAPDDAQTAPWFAAIEADPGITPEPYVEPDPEEPSLNRAQWDFMLAIGGLRTPIRAVLDAMDAVAETPEDRAAFAALERMVLHSQRYFLSEILAIVSAHAATISTVLGEVPTEQQITAAFAAALET